MKKILYIGNNLSNKNPTTMVLLTQLLKGAFFEVVNYSDKKNKLYRLIDMCLGVLKHRNSNYLLIDTYSTSNFYYAFFTSQIARLLGLKYIPVLHGGNLPSRLGKSPFLSKLLFKNAEINIAPSNYLLKAFQSAGYKTKCIPNSIDLKEYPFKKRNSIEPKLFWVRAFDEIYNPLLAVEILKTLKKEYPKATLCMVGADKDGSLIRVQKFVKKNDLDNSVEFAGYMDKKDWIKKSKYYNIFINTTNFDNTPVSVIEAMALGFPVISTNVGGLPSLIENKKTGILVTPNNKQQFVKAIVEFISNPEKANELAINARNTVEQFDRNVVKKEWIQILGGC